MKLNPSLLNDQLNRVKTACHEIGHSGGLTHHDAPYDGCMVNGSVSSGHTQYNAHHKDHLNLLN
jgi:predicted Zn-dependent protease